MLSNMFRTPAALAGFLFLAQVATADFTQSCRNICLGSDNPNYLVTECTVSGGATGNPNDDQYKWAEFNLNELLGYQAPNIVYQSNGNFAVNNNPCDLCTISSAGVLNCICSGTIAMIDLTTNIDDVTGVLCFANNEFGPVCGTSSSRRC